MNFIEKIFGMIIPGLICPDATLYLGKPNKAVESKYSNTNRAANQIEYQVEGMLLPPGRKIHAASNL